ncbi:MAG TPA: DMT family transporter [candidate division Zixibacteria bacterium]|nr:DMT family transporter [candidate division Zixibacteria bacterium]
MRSEIIAIFSAMGWAGDSVLVRLGSRRSNIFAAMVVSYVVSAAAIWSYLLTNRSLAFLQSPAMIYFLISGCLQPLVARALFYEGLTRIGVARAGPLRGSEPLFAAAIALAFLHERPGPPVYLGTLLIVGSLWLISGAPSDKARWRWVDCAFPLGAALVSAVSQSLRKQGLNILPDPFVAAGVVTGVSLCLLTLFMLWTGRTRAVLMPRRSALFFLLAALLAVTAQILNFVALGRAEISVIIPLLNTTPLFNVLFSALFLRELEQVTPKIALGAILMVAGVVIITSR